MTCLKLEWEKRCGDNKRTAEDGASDEAYDGLIELDDEWKAIFRPAHASPSREAHVFSRIGYGRSTDAAPSCLGTGSGGAAWGICGRAKWPLSSSPAEASKRRLTIGAANAMSVTTIKAVEKSASCGEAWPRHCADRASTVAATAMPIVSESCWNVV